jgi:sterol desaturase/sphingolipid hydroxylase (fatty acid hydroxylase superfamily)
MIFPLWSVPAIAAIVWVAWFSERKLPATEQPMAAVILDWKLAAIRIGINQLIFPVTGACGIMVVNATGGGWFHLRSDGWWFLLSVAVVILVGDFWNYIVHRAMHKFPVLWAMHSLHHSAETLTIITGARHFWLEDAIHTSAFPVLGIVFKVPPEVLTTIAALYIVPEALVHTNVRLSFGRFALVLNNPQYHRIHHSVEPQHLNKNFGKSLPLFDVIFGTAWRPRKDEFPKTGLPGETATGFLDGIVWPVRHQLSWIRRSLCA